MVHSAHLYEQRHANSICRFEIVYEPHAIAIKIYTHTYTTIKCYCIIDLNTMANNQAMEKKGEMDSYT